MHTMKSNYKWSTFVTTVLKSDTQLLHDLVQSFESTSLFVSFTNEHVVFRERKNSNEITRCHPPQNQDELDQLITMLKTEILLGNL